MIGTTIRIESTRVGLRNNRCLLSNRSARSRPLPRRWRTFAREMLRRARLASCAFKNRRGEAASQREYTPRRTQTARAATSDWRMLPRSIAREFRLKSRIATITLGLLYFRMIRIHTNRASYFYHNKKFNL